MEEEEKQGPQVNARKSNMAILKTQKVRKMLETKHDPGMFKKEVQLGGVNTFVLPT